MDTQLEKAKLVFNPVWFIVLPGTLEEASGLK